MPCKERGAMAVPCLNSPSVLICRDPCEMFSIRVAFSVEKSCNYCFVFSFPLVRVWVQSLFKTAFFTVKSFAKQKIRFEKWKKTIPWFKISQIPKWIKRCFHSVLLSSLCGRNFWGDNIPCRRCSFCIRCLLKGEVLHSWGFSVLIYKLVKFRKSFPGCTAQNLARMQLASAVLICP